MYVVVVVVVFVLKFLNGDNIKGSLQAETARCIHYNIGIGIGIE